MALSIAVANRSSYLIRMDEIHLGGAGFDPIPNQRGIFPLKLPPHSSALASLAVRAVRPGEQRLTLRVRYVALTTRGGVHYADLFQSPAVAVGILTPTATSHDFPLGVGLGAGVAVVSVLLLEYLRTFVRRLGERRRVRNLLFATVGLTLEAVRHGENVPLEAWETLLLTDGYAAQIDALGRWRVKGPAFSRQLSDLYPSLVQFNRTGRGGRSDAGGLQEQLEKVHEALQKI